MEIILSTILYLSLYFFRSIIFFYTDLRCYSLYTLSRNCAVRRISRKVVNYLSDTSKVFSCDNIFSIYSLVNFTDCTDTDATTA